MIWIRIIWRAGGEVVKDETIPYAGAIEKISDSVVVEALGARRTELEFTLEFDPIVVAREYLTD